MRRRVNIWLALLIITIITIGIAWVITAQAFSPSTSMLILAPPKKCSYDAPPLVTCLGSCPVCGNLAGQCSGLFEVQARFLRGANPLYQNQALCLLQPTPPTYGTFRSGSKCLGNFMGFGPHTLFNFGCYR
ncbi:MAG: hypothetical protein WCW26_03240 [Candidatus Buchananbacteria bacterium]